jgi:hypothetical protein
MGQACEVALVSPSWPDQIIARRAGGHAGSLQVRSSAGLGHHRTIFRARTPQEFTAQPIRKERVMRRPAACAKRPCPEWGSPLLRCRTTTRALTTTRGAITNVAMLALVLDVDFDSGQRARCAKDSRLCRARPLETCRLSMPRWLPGVLPRTRARRGSRSTACLPA